VDCPFTQNSAHPLQRPERLKLTAAEWEALASSWARRGMPMGRVKTARRCVEVGFRLQVLKEVTPHGEFLDRVNALGLDRGTARRYMAVARRFCVASDAFFEAIGTASKLVELLPLDEAEALARGKPVHDLTLDRVAQMTVKELRAAVRAVVAKERSESRVLIDRVIAHGRLAAVQRAEPKASTSTHLPGRGVRLNPEEERMLRRYRKCNPEGRAALLQVAGLLEHKPKP